MLQLIKGRLQPIVHRLWVSVWHVACPTPHSNGWLQDVPSVDPLPVVILAFLQDVEGALPVLESSSSGLLVGYPRMGLRQANIGTEIVTYSGRAVRWLAAAFPSQVNIAWAE